MKTENSTKQIKLECVNDSWWAAKLQRPSVVLSDIKARTPTHVWDCYQPTQFRGRTRMMGGWMEQKLQGLSNAVNKIVIQDRKLPNAVLVPQMLPPPLGIRSAPGIHWPAWTWSLSSRAQWACMWLTKLHEISKSPCDFKNSASRIWTAWSYPHHSPDEDPNNICLAPTSYCKCFLLVSLLWRMSLQSGAPLEPKEQDDDM